MLSIIVAINQNRGIGHENKLLYWLPNDLKRFKALTTGHTIIMGRKTFESLPKGALPNRRNIVLSRSCREFEGAECFHTLEESLCERRGSIYHRRCQPLCGSAPACRPSLRDGSGRQTGRSRCLLPCSGPGTMARKK